MKVLLAAAAVAALFTTAASAQVLQLGPSGGLQSQPCDEESNGGGQISTSCITKGKGAATFQAAGGPYTIGTMSAVFGPKNAAGVLPGGGAQQFTYGPDSANNYTIGTLNWSALTLTNELLGVYVPTVATGTPAFVAAFPVDGKTTFSAELNLGGGYTPQVLLDWPGKSGLASYSSGDIVGKGQTCHTVTTTVCE